MKRLRRGHLRSVLAVKSLWKSENPLDARDLTAISRINMARNCCGRGDLLALPGSSEPAGETSPEQRNRKTSDLLSAFGPTLGWNAPASCHGAKPQAGGAARAFPIDRRSALAAT